MGVLEAKVLPKLKKYADKLSVRYGGVRGMTKPNLLVRDFMISQTENIDDDQERNLQDLEWDNLVILDACRHDIYEEVNGPTNYNFSKGSMTRNYIRENFSEGDWSDVVYISSNPRFGNGIFNEVTGRDLEDCFFEVFNSWKNSEDPFSPENVVRDAKTAQKLFPEKKIIIHFMQPHIPFDNHSESSEKYVFTGENYDVWRAVMREEVDAQGAIRQYLKNLEFVMPYVENLVEELEGLSVITSDHGNLIGEGNYYGHPRGYSSVGLRKVPWDVRE